jgi:hypothetical protein
MATTRIRISKTVSGFLDGTAIVQQPSQPYSHDPQVAAAAKSLVVKWYQANRRKDGSCTVALEPLEIQVLRDYVEVMVMGARDNLGWDGAEYLGEYNAGQALLRQLNKH